MIKINGTTGIYDNIVRNPHVRYGRNTVDNFFNFISNQDPNDEIDYEYRYSPNNSKKQINTMSLMGASFEELGNDKISIEDFVIGEQPPKEEFEKRLKSVQMLDLNKDKCIDIAEYGAYMLLEDSRSSINNKPNGVIDYYGQENMLELMDSVNKALVVPKLKNFYQTYHLKEAQEEFLKDKNNSIILDA